MSERFSEREVVTTVTRLTRGRLLRFVEAEFIRPMKGQEGYVFTRVDIARLELLCDLSDDLDLDDAAIDIILLLLDQLHAARKDLDNVLRAVDALPEDVRRHLVSQFKQR